jgi:hypothetical protein
MLIGFEDDEAKNVERPLRMPAVKDSINPDQKSAFQTVISGPVFSTQAWDVAFHDPTSWGLA